MSDLLGSRRRTLIFLTGRVLLGYVLLSTMGAAWPWALAVVACMVCSFFVQSGAGRGVRHRAAREEAGQRPDRRHGGGVRQHRRRRLPDDRACSSAPRCSSSASPVRRSWRSIASLFLVEPAESFATELLTDDNDGARPTDTSAPSGVRRSPRRPARSCRQRSAARERRRDRTDGDAHALPVLRAQLRDRAHVTEATPSPARCGGRARRSPAARCARRGRRRGSRSSITDRLLKPLVRRDGVLVEIELGGGPRHRRRRVPADPRRSTAPTPTPSCREAR